MYGKFFRSIFEGSMCGAGSHVFAVWGYCIAYAAFDGHVTLNPRIMVAQIGESEEKIRQAIDYLCSPDPHSTSKEHGGARLLKEGVFEYFLVNHQTYRNIRNKEERRDYMRLKQRESRSRRKEKSCQQQLLTELTNVDMSTMSTHTDTDVQKNSTALKKTNPSKQSVSHPSQEAARSVLCENLSELSDWDWVEKLKSVPKYSRLNIPKEMAKIDKWLKDKRNVKKTRQLVLSWLEKNLSKLPLDLEQKETPKKQSPQTAIPVAKCDTCASEGLLRARNPKGLPVAFSCPHCDNFKRNPLCIGMDKWDNSLTDQGYSLVIETQKKSKERENDGEEFLKMAFATPNPATELMRKNLLEQDRGRGLPN